MIEIPVAVLVNAFLQAWIALTGIAALWLAMRGGRWLRWGSLLGLLGQPAWLWVTSDNGQYGMFVFALIVTIIWAQAFYEHWLVPAMGKAPGEQSHVR